MNIFFTGSIRGGRAHQPEYASIITALEKFGTVFSTHVSDDTLSQFGETGLPASEILHREQKALEKSGIVIAEVSAPSLGVGYLIARATSMDKKVIALFHGDDTLRLSAVIKGDPRVEVYSYKTGDDIEKILEEVFAGGDGR